MKERGIPLHELTKVPEEFRRVFPFVRVSGNRAWISGHAATNPDGSIYQKLGKVGSDLTKEEAYEAARLTGLSIIASLKEELGDLDRIKRWVRVFGMVNVAPGFREMPSMINGFSDLIIEYGVRRLVSMPVQRWGWLSSHSAYLWRSKLR
jgi:hypothetical protein